MNHSLVPITTYEPTFITKSADHIIAGNGQRFSIIKDSKELDTIVLTELFRQPQLIESGIFHLFGTINLGQKDEIISKPHDELILDYLRPSKLGRFKLVANASTYDEKIKIFSINWSGSTPKIKNKVILVNELKGSEKTIYFNNENPITNVAILNDKIIFGSKNLHIYGLEGSRISEIQLESSIQKFDWDKEAHKLMVRTVSKIYLIDLKSLLIIKEIPNGNKSCISGNGKSLFILEKNNLIIKTSIEDGAQNFIEFENDKMIRDIYSEGNNLYLKFVENSALYAIEKTQ